MTAIGIVFLFSGNGAALAIHIISMLIHLSRLVRRILGRSWVNPWLGGHAFGLSVRTLSSPSHLHRPTFHSFLLGIGLGAEYPCGSVAAAEQSEDPAIARKTQHMLFTLATSWSSPLIPEYWLKSSRHDDRLGFRGRCIRTPGYVLDVRVLSCSNIRRA